LSTLVPKLYITSIPAIEVILEPQLVNAMNAETVNIHSPDIVYPTLVSSTIHVSHIFKSILTSLDT
jgi:hypothetical protein